MSFRARQWRQSATRVQAVCHYQRLAGIDPLAHGYRKDHYAPHCADGTLTRVRWGGARPLPALRTSLTVGPGSHDRVTVVDSKAPAFNDVIMVTLSVHSCQHNPPL